MDWIVENQPVQGTTNPSGNLVFRSQINGGGYVDSLILSSGGNLATVTAQADTDVPLTLKAHSAGQIGNYWQATDSSGNVIALANADYDTFSRPLGKIVVQDSFASGAYFASLSAFGSRLDLGTATLAGNLQLDDGNFSALLSVSGSGRGTTGLVFGVQAGGTPQGVTNGILPGNPAAVDNVIVLGGASYRFAGVYSTFGQFLSASQAANTSVDGLSLVNPTAATSGNQSWSPRLRLSGQGWKTASTAGSQTVDWIVENQPVQGTANPSSNLVIASQINGGGYVVVATLTSGGGLILSSTPTADPHVAGQVWSNSGVLTLSAG